MYSFNINTKRTVNCVSFMFSHTKIVVGEDSEVEMTINCVISLKNKH